METIIVSGLGRCGSSLVMQMLAAAGFEVTGEYPAFEDGRVNLPSTENLWSGEWNGKAVKVLDPHRSNLHLSNCKVIWLDRHIRQQAKSIAKFSQAMMGLKFSPDQIRELECSLVRDRAICLAMFKKSGRPLLELYFDDLIKRPVAEAVRLASFTGTNSRKMDGVVRKRSAECYPGLLEIELLASVA